MKEVQDLSVQGNHNEVSTNTESGQRGENDWETIKACVVEGKIARTTGQ